jgi:hypothetical protein
MVWLLGMGIGCDLQGTGDFTSPTVVSSWSLGVSTYLFLFLTMRKRSVGWYGRECQRNPWSWAQLNLGKTGVT